MTAKKKLDYQKQYYQLNKEKRLEYGRQWALRNSEKIRERKRHYYQENKAKTDETKARWKKANAERVRQMFRRIRLSKYRITPDEYDVLLAEQKGVCAICGKPPAKGKSLHVDHDHVDGQIRGLLCYRCNHALGLLKDSPTIIEAALKYVRGFSQLRLVKRVG